MYNLVVHVIDGSCFEGGGSDIYYPFLYKMSKEIRWDIFVDDWGSINDSRSSIILH